MSHFHDSTQEELRLIGEEFKWESIFQIHRVKPMKIERFQFHLYGQLIGLYLVASITYRMRQLINEETENLYCYLSLETILKQKKVGSYYNKYL